MAWLGLMTGLTICGCIFMSGYTGRFSWMMLCVWCIPVMGMCINYRQGMNINGLVVVLCTGMFLISRRSLTDIRMWNLKKKQKNKVVFGLCYMFCVLFLYYCFWQAQKEGYIPDIMGAGFNQYQPLRIILGTIGLGALAIPMGDMIYHSIDRLWCKQEELVLLSCKFFTASSQGSEKGLWMGYYLDAIHNGVGYHFKMTRRTYGMVKKEKNLRIQVKTGLLGGLYVIENPCPEHVKKVRKTDRRAVKVGLFLFLVCLGMGIWYFWFWLG